VDEVPAHKISPALFALDDEGHIGVRTIDADARVEYHRVEVVRETPDGVWVTGLPPVATLITVGQELVVPGQQVDPVYEPATEMPAKAAEPDQPPTSSAASESESKLVVAAKP
jgi:multidrug efflux system membrane fusion protein